ncbi:unnamed protein product [Urochloa humidicola]
MADGVDDDEVVELRSSGGRGDPGAYTAELKRKFDLYCVAVAKSMEAKSQESSLGYSNSQASGTSQLISEASFDGHYDFRGKPANCGTSKEQSDGGGNFEVKTDPSNAKKMRRLLLNRESARRSRKRREAHLSDLESQVSRLTSENASLLKRLSDMTQKYKDATLQIRNLIAKVNITEEAARRLTGTTLLLSRTSEIPPRIITLSSCASDLASPVAIEDSMRHFLDPVPLQDDQNNPDLPNV